MLRVVVMVSGGGTNLQAILDAVDNGKITNAEVVEMCIRDSMYTLPVI